MNTNKPIKLIIVDDHKLFREGLRMILSKNENIQVLGEAENGEQALEKVKKLNPDLILLDINLPDMMGDEVCLKIKKTHPNIKIIMVTMHAEERFIAELIRLGADGYLFKNDDAKHVVKTIQDCVANNQHDQRISDALKKVKSDSENKESSISIQETEVLKLICKEVTSKEIAARLSISIKTVEIHRKNLLIKTGSKNMAGLVKYAFKKNIPLFDE